VDQNRRRPAENEIVVLVRESRGDKLTGISTHELRERRRARLAPNEEHALESTTGAAHRMNHNWECSGFDPMLNSSRAR
jgi:hypothetical protein